MIFFQLARIAVVITWAVCGGGVSALRTNYNPLKEDDFCRRHSHATAQVNERLYIDGGYINTKASDLRNYTMDHLLYLDLNNDTAKLPALSGPLSKPAPVPRLIGGQLWADQANGRLFQFGGEFPSDEPVLDVPRAMWTYDTYNDTWTLLAEDDSSTSHVYTRPSFGAGAVVEDEGRAYYLGGWVGGRNVPGWKGKRMALPGMVIYNLVDNTWRNETGPPARVEPRVEGVLLFVPAGDNGLLVSFGGVYARPDGTVEPAPMSDIDIYDIAEGFWYTQRATGTIPETRRLFCAGVGSATDGSSHNVYLYGGAATEANNRGYGDVYILSMPSFRWIKWYPDNDKVRTAPHNSLSCNVVRSHQMIIMGGYFPEQNICDVPSGFGVHNLDMSAYNELSTQWFGYNKTDNGYLVPKAVVDVIGGSMTGKAQTLTPSNGGFTEPALQNLFSRTFTPQPRNPTRLPPSPPPAPKKPTTPIIAGAAGAAAVFLLAALLGIFILHRRRKHRERLLMNPIGGGGNPAYPYPYPYHNDEAAMAAAAPIDHVTAFQLPTTQSPNIRAAARFPPLADHPKGSPFSQPEGAYGYRGYSVAGFSPVGPTQLGIMSRSSIPPQELPGECFGFETIAGEKGIGIEMRLAEVEVEVAGQGIERLYEEKMRDPGLSAQPEDEQGGGATNISISRRSIATPQTSLSLLRKPNSSSDKSLPPIPVPIPIPIPAIPESRPPVALRKSSSSSRTRPHPPSTRDRDREIPTTAYYPQPQPQPQPQLATPTRTRTPSTTTNDDGDGDGMSMNMPTPTCETAGFARVMSPVAVANRGSVYSSKSRSRRIKKSEGGERREGGERGELGVGVGVGVRYDSEGVRMV